MEATSAVDPGGLHRLGSDRGPYDGSRVTTDHEIEPGVAMDDASTVESDAPEGPATAEVGVIVVNATPWGRVREISTDQGSLVELPEMVETPFSLALPPGRYTVRVENSDKQVDVELTVDVSARDTTRVVADLPVPEVDAVLDRLGL